MAEVFDFAADLTSSAAAAGPRAVSLVRHHGQLVQTKAKANASGRPGPRAITSDFRRGIGFLQPSAYTAVIGTDKAQGRRLEHGFDGPDSLGRIYHQPPYPWLGPAFDAEAGPFADAIAAIPRWTLQVRGG